MVLQMFVPSTALLRLSIHAAGRAIPKKVAQASENHYVFSFTINISSDELENI